MLLSLLALPLLAQAKSFQYPGAGAPGQAQVSVVQDQNRLTLDFSGFDFDSLNTKGGLFEQISMANAGVFADLGMPNLPVIRRTILVNSENVTLDVLNVESAFVSAKEAGLLAPVMPVQAPVEKIAGAFERAPFHINQKIYNQSQFFPATFARISSVGSERGQKLAQVEIMPLRYNAATGEIEYLKHIAIEVNGVPGTQSKDIVVAPGDGDPANEKILVIVGRGFESNPKVTELIASKQARGFEVVTSNMSAIGTTAVQVREHIRALYTSSAGSARPLTYVLLVGDVETLPVYNAGQHVTDNFYAAVDKADYNSDRTYPDLAVGRLSVKNATELEVVVNKILRYEAGNFANRDWIKKMAFLATDDRYTVAEGSHNYVINTYTAPLGYTGLFPANNSAGGDKIYAITNRAGNREVMQAVNDGRVVFSYSGHGATTFWDAPRMTQRDVMSITAAEALPYAMSHACVSGSFAMGGGDSFGETWLKAPKGAIGFYGTTNSSYWDEDDILERTFFDGFFRDNLKSLGYLNINGMKGVRTQYGDTARNTIYYYEIYNLLGDPTVNLLRQ